MQKLAASLLRWLSGKEFSCRCRRHRGCGFDPWVGKIPWRRKWLPTTVCLLGKFHGQRSPVGYSPGGPKQSDTILTLAVKALHCQAVWPPCLTSYSPSTLSLSSSRTNLPSARSYPSAFACAVPSAGTPFRRVSRWLSSLSPSGCCFQALHDHPHLKISACPTLPGSA